MSWAKKAKSRGERLVLGWFEPAKCWRKMIRGKMYYFHHPNSSDGYQAATLELARLKERLSGELPYADEYRTSIQRMRNQLDLYERLGGPEKLGDRPGTDCFLRWSIEVLESASEADRPLPMARILDELEKVIPPEPMSKFLRTLRDTMRQADPVGDAAFNERQKLAELLRAAIPTKGPEPEQQTVGIMIQRFLDLYRAKALSGEGSFDSFGLYKRDLAKFENHAGPATPITNINGKTVTSYYKFLLDLPVSSTTKAAYWRSFKTFVRWAWMEDDSELESLPKNLADKRLKFKTTPQHKVEHLYTNEDIQKALDNVTTKWKAIILLTLNCGFLQVDIDSLRKSQVTGNRLIHKRKKEEDEQDTPTVNYKLWPITVQAIEALPDNGTEFLLANERGGRFLVDGIAEKDGEHYRKYWDSISKGWWRLGNAGEIPQKPFKFLRKTATTRLEHHINYRNLKDLFLGHGPGSVALRHYVVKDGSQPFAPLDEATDWLGKELGLIKEPKKTRKKKESK